MLRLCSLALVASACAITRAPLPADHPANPQAPVGHLAAAPATLSPGVAVYSDGPAAAPAAAPPPAPHHHHMP